MIFFSLNLNNVDIGSYQNSTNLDLKDVNFLLTVNVTSKENKLRNDSK